MSPMRQDELTLCMRVSTSPLKMPKSSMVTLIISLSSLTSGLGPFRVNSCSVDLVLIEGFKNARHAKIEAHRAETGNALIAPGDPTIHAVASDVPLDLDRPVFDLNDTRAIADFILTEVGL